MDYTIAIILLLVVKANEGKVESLDDVLVYPLEAPSKVQKQDSVGSSNAFIEFIEEKLIQHSQALEYLVKMVRMNEELTKQLVENLGKKIEKPKKPEKVEVHQLNRRSNGIIFEDTEHPVVQIGRNIPKYGILFRDLMLKEIEIDDPIPVVELDPASTKLRSRRSLSGPPKSVAILEDNNALSPWCSVAMLCRRTFNPVCGFDDNFGFGKFDDLCHMLTVNCYWKYNFAMVPSCKPTS